MNLSQVFADIERHLKEGPRSGTARDGIYEKQAHGPGTIVCLPGQQAVDVAIQRIDAVAVDRVQQRQARDGAHHRRTFRHQFVPQGSKPDGRKPLRHGGTNVLPFNAVLDRFVRACLRVPAESVELVVAAIAELRDVGVHDMRSGALLVSIRQRGVDRLDDGAAQPTEADHERWCVQGVNLIFGHENLLVNSLTYRGQLGCWPRCVYSICRSISRARCPVPVRRMIVDWSRRRASRCGFFWA